MRRAGLFLCGARSAIRNLREKGATMAKNPRNYPDTMISWESGRPMRRGEKLVSFKIGSRTFKYKQPGWWCSLTDPSDTEGQLVDGDNQIAEMARRTAGGRR